MVKLKYKDRVSSPNHPSWFLVVTEATLILERVMYLFSSSWSCDVNDSYFFKHPSSLFGILSREFPQDFKKKNKKYKKSLIYDKVGSLIIERNLCDFAGAPFIRTDSVFRPLFRFDAVDVDYFTDRIEQQLVEVGDENQDPNEGKVSGEIFHFGPVLPVNPRYFERVRQGHEAYGWARGKQEVPEILREYLVSKGLSLEPMSVWEMEDYFYALCSDKIVKKSRFMVDLTGTKYAEFIGFNIVNVMGLEIFFRAAMLDLVTMQNRGNI